MKTKLIEGTIYYRCEDCGELGNWKTFIKEKRCCLEKRKNANSRNKQIKIV